MNRNGKKNKNYAELIKEFIKNNKKRYLVALKEEDGYGSSR